MVFASSHAEASGTSMDRYADNTDVYAFRSSEAGRSGFVTLIANFIPIQDPSGGPQFYRFDDTVLCEIKIDNTGDGIGEQESKVYLNGFPGLNAAISKKLRLLKTRIGAKALSFRSDFNLRT